MSKANVKTTRMTCKYTKDAVIYNYEITVNGNWVIEDTRGYSLAEIENKIYEDGETQVTLAAYGLRALLADRTSQLRELGPKAVLKGMDGYYDLLKSGQWKATRKAGGAKRVDMVLVEVVAKLKKCPLAAAEELVRKAPAETIEALKAKYAKEYAAVEAKARSAEAGADLGDLLE